MLQIMSLLFGLVVNTSAAPQISTYIPVQEWQALKGDRLIADTQENIGYLVHENGDYTSFTIGSGKRQTVRYIGLTYNATTPQARWTVKSLHIQGDKGTFGKSGRFMRLYKDGKDHTSYGIHSIGNIDDMLTWKTEDRYISMGCVIVSDDILDILYKTYDLNGQKLDVVTTYGISETLLAQLGNS